MRRTLRDFIVGLTALLGVAGLAAMLLMFGELDVFARKTGYEVTFILDDAGGLVPGSVVSLNGVRIGSVVSTTMPEDPRKGVLISARIREAHRVPWDATVGIRRDLLGETTLNLTIGADAPDGGGFMEAGDQRRTAAKGMFDDLASMVDARLATIEETAASIKDLSETYTRVGERIETMLAPPAPGAGPNDPNVARTLANLDAALLDAREWLGDDQLRADAQEATRRATAVLNDLSGAIERWDTTAEELAKAATKAGDKADEAAADFKVLAGTMSEAMFELQGLIAEVRSGDGTIAQLVNNPDLYRSLNDAATRLERTLLEAQLLLEKYRKEGIPIQF